MTSWVMAVEVTSSELVAVELVAVETDRTSGALRPRRAPLRDGGDPVDGLADAFAALLDGPDRPARLVIATPTDTERRRFEEIAEATALVGLPAPSWLPGPVALVGDRIAAEVAVGGRAIVLDARGGGLTAWPVLRTADGADIGARGPVATGARLDQLLLGVVRAQLRSFDPAPPDDGGSRGDGDARGDAARLRREIRRARTRLADTDADEARISSGGHTVTVERAVFDQLVEHAVTETVTEIDRSAEGVHSASVHVLADRPDALARRLAALVAGADQSLVVPRAADDGVLGLAALLLPARPRVARAASGAQAIRARRAVGSPSAPVGVGAAAGDRPGGPPIDARTPPYGLDVPGSEPGTGAHDGGGTGAGSHDEATAGTDPDGPAIPAARLPSTPVQAQHRGAGSHAFGAGAAAGGAAATVVGLVPDTARPPTPAHGTPANGIPTNGIPTNGAGALGHTALAAARPHEARPISDAPPGNSGPLPRIDLDEASAATGPPSGSTAVVRRRGPDTAPQPIAATGPGGAPRGMVLALGLLLLIAVLAAVGVLVLGPAEVAAAFGGLGAGLIG